jgi:hypothetical protein
VITTDCVVTTIGAVGNVLTPDGINVVDTTFGVDVTTLVGVDVD